MLQFLHMDKLQVVSYDLFKLQGKTYTMEGPKDKREINFRTVISLFQVVEQRKNEYKYKITVSITEIYNNVLYDLLATKRKKLKIFLT